MNSTPWLRSGLYLFTMWREGYDYPADDEDDGRDYYEEADEQHDKQQDQTLDQ